MKHLCSPDSRAGDHGGNLREVGVSDRLAEADNDGLSEYDVAIAHDEYRVEVITE